MNIIEIIIVIRISAQRAKVFGKTAFGTGRSVDGIYVSMRMIARKNFFVIRKAFVFFIYGKPFRIRTFIRYGERRVAVAESIVVYRSHRLRNGNADKGSTAFKRRVIYSGYSVGNNYVS